MLHDVISVICIFGEAVPTAKEYYGAMHEEMSQKWGSRASDYLLSMKTVQTIFKHAS